MAPGSDQPLGGSLDALHSTESEAELIGSAMYMPDVCEAAGLFDKVTRAHIFDLGHEAIWGAIIDLWKAGIAPKPALVRDRIGANEHFDALGGLLYLNNLLADSSPSTASFHADAIVDRHARRQLFAAASDAAARCIDLASGPATSLLDELEKQTSAIAAGATRGTAWINAGDMIADAVEKARQRKGGIEFPTGLTLLDETMGGLHRGDLSLLGARPGMAKTVSAQAIAKNISAAGRGVAFFSLEMGGEPMALRLAVDLTFDRDAPIYNNQDAHNITLDRINKQDLQPHEWDRLTQAGQIVKSWPLAYDVRPSLTMADIRAALRIQFRHWEKAGVEPGLVVIDHLGKVKPTKDRRGSMNAEMADVSRESADLAKEFDIPVLGLVQLNRGVEGRDDKRPGLADLRWAGELEQDARQVMFLYRPEYYLREGADNETEEKRLERERKLADARNKLFWIIAKNSHGPANVQVQTFVNLACSAVRDWDRQQGFLP